MYMPKWEPYYKLLADELASIYIPFNFENYMEGTIHLHGGFDAVCEVVSENGDADSIKIRGRANCGPAFDGDKVGIELVKTRDREDDKEITRGTVVAIKKRRIHRCARVFVCTVDRNKSNLMTPLCGSVPKFHVIDTSSDKKYGREKNSYVDVYKMENETPVCIRRLDLKRKGQEHTLFAVKYLKWNHKCPFPLGYVCKVIPIKKDIVTNQNVINLLHQIDMSEISETDPRVGDYAEYVDNFYKRVLIDNQRKNLEHLLTFSIDPFWCRCVDDAFSIEEVNKNLFQIWIHISDVSHFVKKGEEVDTEAQAKGRTHSTADRSNASFMLPPELSTGGLSLKECQHRFAISVCFEMDTEGRLHGEPNITKSVIVNKRELTYKEAQDTIKQYRGVNNSEGMNDIDQRVIYLHKLAKKLCARRLKEAQHYYSCTRIADNQVNTCEDGQCHDAHRLVEEFMILTNQTIAKYLLQFSTEDLIPLRQQRK